MACINKSLKEFKELEASFPNKNKAYALAQLWQSKNKSDSIPTYEQVKTLQKSMKKESNKKKSDLKTKVVDNLIAMNLLEDVNGKIYVKINQSDYNTNLKAIDSKYSIIKNYLEYNNIPANYISVDVNDANKPVKFLPNNIYDGNPVLNKKSPNLDNTRKVLDFLIPKFPGLDYQFVSLSDAKVIYDAIPDELKEDVDFNQVKSFFNPINNQVVLIDSRVTDDVAIEEVLHPLVAGIKLENEQLFNNLFEESKANFPELFEKIDRLYEKDTEEEIVTQALVKHFKKEYEKTPTQGFLNSVAEFLKNFLNKIIDFYSVITGGVLPVKNITSDTTLTEIAKLLNTSDLTLSYNIPEQMRVKYALSENKQSLINNALENGTEQQKKVILSLFSKVMNVPEKYDQFSVSSLEQGPFQDQRSLIILDEATHVYQNVFNKNEKFLSSTSTFNSFDDKERNFDFNRYMGNIFDKVLENIILGNSIKDTIDNLNQDDLTPLESLDKDVNEQEEQITKIYIRFNDFLSGVKDTGDILLPQVIVHSRATDKANYKNVAGAIDVLAITPEGKLKVIDLKTSKNSIKSSSYNEAFSIKGTLLNEASKKAGRKEIDKLSLRQKHVLQLSIYSSMLENMGYELDHDNPFFSINIRIGVQGLNKEQKYTNLFEFEGKNAQKIKADVKGFEISQYPTSISEVASSYIIENKKFIRDNEEFLKSDSKPIPEEVQKQLNVEKDNIKTRLEKYKQILVKRKQAIKDVNNKIFISGKPEMYLKKIDKVMGMISLAITSDDIQQANRMFNEILSDSIRQADNFIDYLQAVENKIEKDFLVYVNNAKKFTDQFMSLYLLKDNDIINNTLKVKMGKLQSKLNQISSNEGDTLSLADQALFDYVRYSIEQNTTQEFEAGELDKLMKESLDISGLEYYTRDLATSRDVFLRVMNKILRNKKREIAEMNNRTSDKIILLGKSLEKASSEKDPEKFHDFMINEDGTLVVKESQDFVEKRHELRKALYNKKHNRKEYIVIADDENFTQDQIDYNLELHKAKKAYSEFLSAEKIEGNEYTSGLNYEYTEEFINARNRYQYFKNSGGETWARKIGVSDREYSIFMSKYYDKVDYTTILYEDGKPTGKTIFREGKPFPKIQYKRLKDVNSNGDSLVSSKYESIMKPTDNLGRVQKNYYLEWTKEMNNQLENIPAGQKARMYGRIPLVRNRFATDFTKKPIGVQSIWVKLKDTVNSIVSFFTDKSYIQGVSVNEFGEVIDGIPIRYTGKPKDQQQLKDIDDKLQFLEKQSLDKKITNEEYLEEKKILLGQRDLIDSRPTSKEISRDLTQTLMQFSLMAQNYSVMSEAENIFNTFISVIEKKQFKPNGSFKYGIFQGKEFEEKATVDGVDSYVKKRAKAFMDMVVYEKDKVPKSKFDKLVRGILKYTSFSYVSLNPFGSYNNYLFGKLSNYNEAFGQRFFSRKSYSWAETEFKKKGIQSIINRTSMNQGFDDEKSMYDPDYALSKYEAMVQYYAMMDKYSDIRELGYDSETKSSWKNWAINKSFILQDWGEYTNQTKVGMAIMKDIIIQDKERKMPEISLYDAYVFEPGNAKNKETAGIKFKKGYEESVIIKGPGSDKTISSFKFDPEEIISDDIRFNIRAYIREVNKQIHGNYADEDRMVIQAHSVGKLFAQFHKWVAPAFHARYQSQYYDENLGWMEGKYTSAYKMINFLRTNTDKVKLSVKEMTKEYMEYENIKRKEGMTDDQWNQILQKNENRIIGLNRTISEVALIFSIMAVSSLVSLLLDDDDDELEEYTDKSLNEFNEKETVNSKRFFNWVRYQVDRTESDFSVFLPVFPSSFRQMMKMIDSPIASTRTLGELGEAMSYTLWTPFSYVFSSEEDFMKNSEYVYQRGSRKGQLKVWKNWSDAIPVAYSINKWISFEDIRNFYIK
tara:strand:- start:1138 stop:6888 length:5751 start_codon:yes stop_codon:yes gene_type:complete